MTRVVVNVMLKPEILDPQGEAIARALPRLGFGGVASVRQGKRFEIEIAGPEPTEPGPTETTEPIAPLTPAGYGEPRYGEPADEPTYGESTGVSGSDAPAGLRQPSEPSGLTELSEEDALAKARQIAETLLANPVIENFEVRVVS